MPKTVRIFGKDTWPYTTAAREAYVKDGYEVEYLNVLKDRSLLTEMLKASKGDRSVPVIVDGSKVQIGYGGAW